MNQESPVHVFPARVISADAVWYPTTAEQNAVAEEVYVDERHGHWRKSMTAATVELAPADLRAEYGTERLWFARGLVDGEPTTWVIEYARGCGCGSTSTQTPNANQRAMLAAAEA